MKLKERIKQFLFVKLRIWKFQFLSDCKNVSGYPIMHFPILLKGKGKISFGSNVQNGVIAAQNLYSAHNYLLALEAESEIVIGSDVVLANGCSLQAVSKITIEDNVMIGINCFLIDTDGHDLAPDKRMTGTPLSGNITIKRNAVVYYNSIVMKGVTIGENSIIGSCSVVTRDIPPNVFAAGNPARVIRNL
ncbi:MAG TPA: acyltransferase [Flavobacterium sp.]|jgi:maltose O-acetyltransferase